MIDAASEVEAHWGLVSNWQSAESHSTLLKRSPRNQARGTRNQKPNTRKKDTAVRFIPGGVMFLAHVILSVAHPGCQRQDLSLLFNVVQPFSLGNPKSIS
jgi:hypothetical protein